MPNTKTFAVNNEMVVGLQEIISLILKRKQTKINITGAVGEIMVCHSLPKLRLRLVSDDHNAGYDAIDRDGKKVQIKARRPHTGDVVKPSGRTGWFKEAPFDYGLLVLLNSKYHVYEIWRADGKKIARQLKGATRRDMVISTFRRLGIQLFPDLPRTIQPLATKGKRR